MLSKIFFSFFLLSTALVKAQQNNIPNTQNTLTNKIYIAEVGEACKEMTDGGCMIYTFCVLNFKKDSVVISYKIKADCSPKERERGYEHLYDNQKNIYKWAISNKNIVIKNFNEYGKLILQGNKIIGEKKINNNKFKKIEFVQDTKK